MPAERGQLIEPLVAGVGPIPVEAPLLGLAEPARRPYPVGGRGAQPPVGVGRRAELKPQRRGPGRTRRYTAANASASLGRGLERVPEHREPAAGAQHPGRLAPRRRPGPPSATPGPATTASNRRPAGSHASNVATSTVRPPPPGEVGHPGVRLDPEDPAAGRRELPGRDAGAAADVEHVGAGARGDDPVDQRLGVAGPGPVVPFGVRRRRTPPPAGAWGSCSLR